MRSDNPFSLAWLATDNSPWRRHFLLKQIGMWSFMTIFFVAYFHLLRHPVYPVFTMPTTIVDEWIGFAPWTIWLYVSLWIYIGVPVLMMTSRKGLFVYCALGILLSAPALICFHFWPTTVVPVDAGMTSSVTFRLLQKFDAASNACPSMHVASAVFTGYFAARLMYRLGASWFWQFINFLWCLGIVHSTLATRQHVSLDVAAGFLLAAVVCALTLPLHRHVLLQEPAS